MTSTGKGVVTFGKTFANEIVKVGAKMAVGAQKGLEWGGNGYEGGFVSEMAKRMSSPCLGPVFGEEEGPGLALLENPLIRWHKKSVALQPRASLVASRSSFSTITRV